MRGRKRTRPPLERTVQEHIKRLIALAGGFTYSLSQSRATRQTPGLPDLIAFVPLHDGSLALGFIEVKRDGRASRLSPYQRRFAAQVAATSRYDHVAGDLEAVVGWLEALGRAQSGFIAPMVFPAPAHPLCEPFPLDPATVARLAHGRAVLAQRRGEKKNARP